MILMLFSSLLYYKNVAYNTYTNYVLMLSVNSRVLVVKFGRVVKHYTDFLLCKGEGALIPILFKSQLYF